MEATQSKDKVVFNHHDKTIYNVQDLIDFLTETVGRHQGYRRDPLYTERHGHYLGITHAKIIDDNIIFELENIGDPFAHEDE